MQSASSPAVEVATSLLVVIATLMPLLAVFIQFAVRFYSDAVGEGRAGQYGRQAVFVILLALAAVAWGGIQAGDVIKFNTSSNRVGGAVTSLQIGFAFIVAAAYFIGRDVVRTITEDLGDSVSDDISGASKEDEVTNKASENVEEEISDDATELEETEDA
jgi:hypothetical protein